MAQRVIANRYIVREELGRGGIGVVWRAEDSMIGRSVALKELRVPPGLSTTERDTFTERALREARTAGRLSDPSIVTVYDVIVADGAMFIVMELVEAPTLADVVAAQGPLPADRVASIGLQVLSALETAHAAGVVHRDVKPSNIMMLADDKVKLADFGIAQAMDDPSLTGTSGVMGSPGYMAPELFAGHRPTAAGDLWSLGATLYHLVEGKAPFQRDTTAATIHAIMYSSPDLSRADGPLGEVIIGLLSLVPEARPSADRVRDLLRHQQSDDRRTEVMTPVPAPAEDDRTTRVDVDRTTAVSTRHGTRPLDGDTDFLGTVAAPHDVPWAADGWADEPRAPRRSRRGVLFAAGGVVLALALAGVAVAMNGGSRPTASDGPIDHTAGTIVDPDMTIVIGTTITTTTTTTTTTVTTTTTTRPTTTTTKAPVAPPPTTTTVAPTTTTGPKLTYVALEQYLDRTTNYHITLTPGGTVPRGFTAENGLGHLVTTSAPGTVKFYLCEVSSGSDYFSSVDQSGTCEGQKKISMQGYIYEQQPSGTVTVPLYRCNAGNSHFDSLSRTCGGHTVEGILGYVD